MTEETEQRAAGRARRRRRGLVPVVALGAVAVLAAAAVRSPEPAAPRTPPPLRAERPATTAAPADSTTTTIAPVPETTVAPPPAPEPTVAAAAPPPTPPPLPPPPPPGPPPTSAPRPLRILVAGDSLGFTAAFPPPTRAELPGFIASVEPAAMIGCGVLAGTWHRAIDEAGEGAGVFDCSGQVRAELEGLSRRPDWMVFFSGAWEHLSWVAPDGRVLAAGSPELRATLLFELVRRASAAASVGTRTAFVAWVCPHGVAATRTGPYAHWYNAILREAAAAVPGAFVVEPTERVCVGADAGGLPTAEKLAAFRDHHPTDRAWLWKEWIGPSVNGRR